MKTKNLAALLLCVLALIPSGLPAQTTNLTALLQQGLFEEQANRNLDAAIADYQALARQFDKDRQLAATAVFRLGECYRMQGKTNEAALEYQRILRDFADEQTLATLSRQNLTGMGMTPAPAVSSALQTQKDLLAKQIALAEQDLADTQRLFQTGVVPQDKVRTAEREVLRLKQQLAALDSSDSGVSSLSSSAGNSDARLWDRLKNLPPDKLEALLPTLVPDAGLTELLRQRNAAETKLAELHVDYSTNYPDYQKEVAVLKTINQQVAEKIDGMMQALKMRVELSQTSVATSEATDEEAQEIQHIQTMIQNSPDLINAASDGTTPLVKAAYNGWLKVAAYLLDHGADVNVPCAHVPGAADMSGPNVTPLIAAVTAGNKAMTEYLISRGANIKYKGRIGDTPLHVAAQKGFQAVVDALLVHHADVNTQNANGATPLFSAVSGGRIPIVKVILAAGADVNLLTSQSNSVLNYAIGTSSEMMQALLNAGANPNTVDATGRTPLSYTVERGSSQGNRQFGSGIGGRSAMPGGFGGGGRRGLGAMPINRPTETDLAEVVKMLLAAKADPNGGTLDAPLLCAVFGGKTECAQLLLAAGANPNIAGRSDIDSGPAFGGGLGVEFRNQLQNHRDHLTPLWLATLLNEPSIVQLLLKYKADPNDSQTDERALIFNALDKPEILTALLDAGAKVDAIGFSPNAKVGNDEFRWTPLGMAAFMNSGVSVESLLKHAANPNFRDPIGHYTPLHWAADRVADRQVFELLLAYKADRNVRDINGQTPLDILKEKAKPENLTTDSAGKAKAEELADMLRKHGALDVLPDWDRITVSRPSANFSQAVFQKGTNDWNQFTLFEALAVHYGLVSANPRPHLSEQKFDPNNFMLDGSLQFPNLDNVIIRRPGLTNGTWREIKVNVSAKLKSGDCSQDVRLEWGDQIELQEADHPMSAQWPGLPKDDQAELRNCLKRLVQLTVKGQTTNIVLEAHGFGPNLSYGAYGKIFVIPPQFSLAPVLDNSGLIRASSDLSRVKVAREHDPVTGKPREWTVDCSNPSSPPNFWLRDGDVIEVPGRP